MIDDFIARPRVLRLDCPVQSYDWGGTAFIPGLLGRPNPARAPQAELWIGAHPKSPSVALIGDQRVPLDRLIAAAPEVCMGACAARFPDGLPFLFKVLDAHTMLSIQAHPSKEQAEAGYAEEDRHGIPLSAGNRNYRDRNHKPEVHVALTDFWMLHGFRPIAEIADVLTTVPEFAAIAPGLADRARAAETETEQSGLVRDLYERCMRMPQSEANAVVDGLLARIEAGPPPPMSSPDYWALKAGAAFVGEAGDRDRGLFSIYLLNLVHLEPGEGTYQPSGTLHAYLSGANVELMANSDNVLRGGLTNKHVDVAELLGTLSFAPGIPEVLRGAPADPGVRVYGTPCDEFELARLDVSTRQPVRRAPRRGPEALLMLEGEARLDGGEVRPLRRGDVVFVPDAVGYELTTEDAAVLFRASVPPDPSLGCG